MIKKYLGLLTTENIKKFQVDEDEEVNSMVSNRVQKNKMHKNPFVILGDNEMLKFSKALNAHLKINDNGNYTIYREGSDSYINLEI